MGCDIHCTIEFKGDRSDRWSAFGKEFNPGRNYSIFAKMAGVRNYEGYGITPITEPRGILPDLSLEAREDGLYFIIDRDTTDHENKLVSREQASKWVESGSSQFYDGDQWITHPDRHSWSWLYTSEFDAVMSDPKIKEMRFEPEYECILVVMKHLVSHGYQVRLVFNFDN